MFIKKLKIFSCGSIQFCFYLKEVLKKYVADEALHSPVPLPAHRSETRS